MHKRRAAGIYTRQCGAVHSLCNSAHVFFFFPKCKCGLVRAREPPHRALSLPSFIRCINTAKRELTQRASTTLFPYTCFINVAQASLSLSPILRELDSVHSVRDSSKRQMKTTKIFPFVFASIGRLRTVTKEIYKYPITHGQLAIKFSYVRNEN